MSFSYSANGTLYQENLEMFNNSSMMNQAHDKMLIKYTELPRGPQGRQGPPGLPGVPPLNATFNTINVRDHVTIGGDIHSNKTLNIKGGTSVHNPAGWQSHFPWHGDGKNYIRGDTEMRGETNQLGKLSINDMPIFLRSPGDPWHQIKYEATSRRGNFIDGPRIQGNNGGVLASGGEGGKDVLRWNNDSVIVDGKLCVGNTCISEEELKNLLRPKNEIIRQPPTSLMFEIILNSLSLPTVDTTGKTITASSSPPTIVTDSTRGKVLSLQSSYLFVPNFDISASYTKMCWVNSKTANQGTGNLISSYTVNSKIHYMWYNGTTKLHAGHSGSGQITPRVIDPVSTPTDTWTHYALTYDQSSTTMNLYRDAKLVSSFTNQSLSWPGGDGKLGIGTFGGGNIFTGYLDNIRVFNVVLSANQINAIYNQESSGGNWNYTW